jgi:hypothetical protein
VIKANFPGLVTIEERTIVPDKWAYYFLIKDADGEVLAKKIKRQFWVSLLIATHISILHICWTFLKQWNDV